MLPNFLVIGGQRCGSSSLCAGIRKHSQVYFSEPKELHFFSDDRIYAKGREWYESYFADAAGHAAIGEGSVTYCSPVRQPSTLDRIVEHLGHVKVVHIARHPLKRMESSWRLWQARSPDTLVPFLEAIETGQLLQNSLYHKQIEPFRQRFGDDSLLALQFEDFIRDPRSVLSRVFDFLGVDPQEDVTDPGNNVNDAAKLRVDPVWLRSLKRLNGYERLRRLVPRQLSRPMKDIMKAPVDLSNHWTPAAYRLAAEQVQEDARAYLEYCGKPAEFWDFEPSFETAVR